MKRFLTSFAALGLVLALSGTSRANLITNGSFETSAVYPTAASIGTFKTLTASTASASAITGWTVTSGSIDYIGNYWQAADGVRSIDLSGNGAGALAIAQTITTVIGQKYYLSFDMAGNPDGGPTTKSLTVTLGPPSTAATFTFSTAGHSKSNMGWTLNGFYFTANSTSTSISFQSNTSTPYGPALDNVSLVAVPEPASLAMSGTALLAVTGLVLRRRKARITQA